MARVAGILGLIFGIIAISPLPLFLAVYITTGTFSASTLTSLSLFTPNGRSPTGEIFLILFLIPILGLVLGIVGAATAKENSKGPGIVGIVFSAIEFVMQLIIWPYLLVLILLGGILGG